LFETIILGDGMGVNIESLKRNLSFGKIRVGKTKAGIYKNVNLLPENTKKILDFDNEFSMQFKPKTRMVYLTTLLRLAVFLKDKPFEKATKEDFVKFFTELKDSGVKENTINTYGFRILKFIQWVHNMKGREYPECIDWFHPKRNRNMKLPDDLPTEEDVKTLINTAKNIRDKALVSVLYETGARCHEFLKMKIRDIIFDEYGAKILLHSDKTDDRVVRIVDSVGYLKEWLKNHPMRTEPDAYVWIDCMYRRRKWNYGKVFTYSAVWHLLRRLGKEANLKIKVRPHLLRHLRLTILSKSISEMSLRKIAGWKDNSSMPEVYLHYNNKDIDEQVLEKVYDFDLGCKQQRRRILPPEEFCIRCKKENPIGSEFCLTCGSPLTDEASLKLDMIKKIIAQILSEAWKQPNPKEALPHIVEQFKQNMK